MHLLHRVKDVLIDIPEPCFCTEYRTQTANSKQSGEQKKETIFPPLSFDRKKAFSPFERMRNPENYLAQTEKTTV